jgi:hypothetical protein
MRKVVSMRIYLLLIYVDDLLLLMDLQEAKRLEAILTNEFQWITMSIGLDQSYLGMHIVLEKHQVVVDMIYFIQQLLQPYTSLKPYLMPGTSTFFQIDETSPTLNSTQKKQFHTTTAKLLYLSKRSRPDLLTTTSFLCTRVKEPTQDDQNKLLRVLGYLQRTQKAKMYLKPKLPFSVEAYIDAAFASHHDSKSHSGVAVYIGNTLVYASSRKQKCMTKSPTESELVALTDNLGLIELFEEFVSFIQNRSMGIPIIYQDSTSVITLVTKGGGVVRTRHLRACMNLGQEAIQDKKVEVLYCPAKKMRADGLTKTLEGIEFKMFFYFMLSKA